LIWTDGTLARVTAVAVVVVRVTAVAVVVRVTAVAVVVMRVTALDGLPESA
jgi:hypothetical protein